MTLFKQSQFANIKGPIYTTNLLQNINGNTYDIPHIMFPGYSYSRNTSFVDAVALTGIQKELIYNQNLENIHYNNPYLEEKHLLTKYKKSQASDEESWWKNQSYYYSRDINCEGRIIRMVSDQNKVLVITDQYEIVILDKQMNIQKKISLLQDETLQVQEQCEQSQILDAHLSLYKEYNVSGIISMRCDQSIKYIVFNVNDDNLFYYDAKSVENKDLLQSEKSPMFASYDNDIEGYRQLGKFLYKYKPEQLQSINYFSKDQYLYYQTPLVIILTNLENQTTYTYLKKRGILITSNDEQQLIFTYLSGSLQQKNQQNKMDIFSQTLDLQKLKNKLNYVTKISTQNSVVEANAQVDLSKIYASSQVIFEPLTTFVTTKPVAIFITPLGHLTMININNGKRLFIDELPEIENSTNCQLKLISVNNNTLISIQIQRQTLLYNMNNGKLVAEMQTPNDQQVYQQDTLDVNWSQIQQELNSNIFSTKMSIYNDDQVIINVRATLMDVIGVGQQQNGIFASYSSRVLMIIFVGCILLSAFSLIKERNYVYEEK